MFSYKNITKIKALYKTSNTSSSSEECISLNTTQESLFTIYHNTQSHGSCIHVCMTSVNKWCGSEDGKKSLPCVPLISISNCQKLRKLESMRRNEEILPCKQELENRASPGSKPDSFCNLGQVSTTLLPLLFIMK